TLFRKVAVSERLPEVSKWNIDFFLLEFDIPRKGRFIQGFVANGLFIDTHRDGYSAVNIPFDPQPTYWLEEIPDPTAQLQADKEELLQALGMSLRLNKAFGANSEWIEVQEIESLIQKHKP